ncbi:MAG TPA: hypothetical protein VGL35_10480 [Rhizomicrobium sp.]|jgi:hypothetical protein
MKTHEFTIIASGLDPEADDFEDRFFEAGCGDATIAFQKGVIVLEFAREAPNFLKAVTSAIDDVQRAGATVERVEPDHLVSLSEIARRAGLTRSAISLYAKGARAEGFPAPVARVMTENPLWDWYEVARWMRSHERRVGLHEVLQARIVRQMNLLVVEQRMSTGRVGKVLRG